MDTLRFVEELLLLLLRDDGYFLTVRSWSLRRALAGAVLMDLALEDRIDTDLENLILVDATPLGDGLLDPTLAQIAATNEQRGAHYWVGHVAGGANEIRDQVLARLIEKGILGKRDNSFLWGFETTNYQVIDSRAVSETQARITNVLFSDEIPDPRDVVIIALAGACGIFEEMLSEREFAQVSDRITQVSNYDLIAQAMSEAIRDIDAWAEQK
ncbi:MAG: GPP34 family phosphoprotein [Acidimicrobiaceae bacterium]|nr:GPP34 family phosphoprotein [Acidimicrobiaceae bacterium]